MTYFPSSKLEFKCVSVNPSVENDDIMVYVFNGYTVRWHYNALQYDMILHISLQLPRQNINQSFNPQKIPHT